MVSAEADWPQLGFATGFRNSTMPGLIRQEQVGKKGGLLTFESASVGEAKISSLLGGCSDKSWILALILFF